MIAIKNWFLQKNDLNWMRNYTLEVVKETEKAVLVRINDRTVSLYTEQHWIPKSCIIDRWEVDTSNFAYHDYLVDTLNNAYRTGKIECKTYRSGRNTYDSTSFTHQWTTKELMAWMTKNNIEFMKRADWNKREA